MRIVTYNVHSCLGVDRALSPARIANVIKHTAPDVACLQELDVSRKRTGLVDQAEVIAADLTMTSRFHPAIQLAEEKYGDAILATMPMALVRAGTLPRVRGVMEPRGALWVEIECEGVVWQIINTHFGLGRIERRAQAKALVEWIREALAKPPVVVCGDLNSRPASAVHALFREHLLDAQLCQHHRHQRTFATRFPWICLDYIYVSPDVEVLSADVIRTPLTLLASDHFPLVADLQVKSKQGSQRPHRVLEQSPAE